MIYSLTFLTQGLSLLYLLVHHQAFYFNVLNILLVLHL